MVPTRTHDWRMFVKPHELTFLLQTRGFLVDSAQFRGLAPTLTPDPRVLISQVCSHLAPEPCTAFAHWRARVSLPPQLSRRPRVPNWLPPLPLSDFVEVRSLEVQYMGWASKPPHATTDGPAGGSASRSTGEYAKGLRDFRR